MTVKKVDENKIDAKRIEKLVSALDNAKTENAELKAQLKKYKNCKCGIASPKEPIILSAEEEKAKQEQNELRKRAQDEKKQEVDKLKKEIDDLKLMLKSKLLTNY